MDRARVSRIAHQRLRFAGPYDQSTVHRIERALEFARAPLILDVGCGEAELLQLLLERYRNARGVGVDLSTGRGPENARARGIDDRIEFHEIDAREFDAEPSSFDLTMCVGSTHVYGGYGKTIEALEPLTRGGGYVLLGEGFWEREPHDAALRGLGATRDELPDLPTLIEAGRSHGLIPVTAEVSDRQQWDRYELSWCSSLERYAAEHPDDPDGDDLLRIAAEHRDGYLRGYRSVLGFALLVLHKPLN